MDQRVAFIADWLRDDWTMTELAARYAISRKTAYKWVDRYAADPAHGLAERSQAPTTHGRAMAATVREAVLALRRTHPHWGPKKLRAILLERQPHAPWPAASTMGDLLRRAAVSQPRRRTRDVLPRAQPLAAAQAPNDVWTAVCDHRRGAAVAFGGVEVEAGDSARSDRSRPSGAERASRTLSSDAPARDDHPASGDAAAAAATV